MLEELERLREGFAKYYPSMAQDVLIHQRQTEVELLNGAIVRYGRELGIPTPCQRGADAYDPDNTAKLR